MKNLIFDYDGTLHNSQEIYIPAFRSAIAYLEQKGLIQPRTYLDTEITTWLGFSAQQMWQSFLPHLPKEEQAVCSKMIGEKMLQLIKADQAQLYPNTLKVLSELKRKGYNLIYLSNCKVLYMAAHIQKFQLGAYFSSFHCGEAYGYRPKYEIFKRIKQLYKGDFIVIGDRLQDMEIAQKHHLMAIGCTYGYGQLDELKAATVKIDTLEQILTTL